ncbi:MAG TPA: hypothetical protein VGJ60_21385 [Chloroflexota bacterium]|jgi:hypothetical protein
MAPVALAGGPYTVPEGGSVLVSGSGTDQNSGDTLTYSYTYSDPESGHVHLPIANLDGQSVLRQAVVTTGTGGPDDN